MKCDLLECMMGCVRGMSLLAERSDRCKTQLLDVGRPKTSPTSNWEFTGSVTVVPSGKWTATAKKEQTRLESKVEKQMHRSCDSETHDRTDARLILSSSSVSHGENSEIIPAELHVTCWNVNKSVAQDDFWQHLESAQAQVLLLQETQHLKTRRWLVCGLGGEAC